MSPLYLVESNAPENAGKGSGAQPIRVAEPGAGRFDVAARFISGASIRLFGAGLLTAAGAWLVVSQADGHARDEERFLYAGNEIRDAIASYYYASPRGRRALPRSLGELLDDNRDGQHRKYLSRLEPDPTTGHVDWEPLRDAEGGIVGVRSRAMGRPVGLAELAAEFAGLAHKPSYLDGVFVAEIAQSGDALAARVEPPPVQPERPTARVPLGPVSSAEAAGRTGTAVPVAARIPAAPARGRARAVTHVRRAPLRAAMARRLGLATPRLAVGVVPRRELSAIALGSDSARDDPVLPPVAFAHLPLFTLPPRANVGAANAVAPAIPARGAQEEGRAAAAQRAVSRNGHDVPAPSAPSSPAAALTPAAPLPVPVAQSVPAVATSAAGVVSSVAVAPAYGSGTPSGTAREARRAATSGSGLAVVDAPRRASETTHSALPTSTSQIQAPDAAASPPAPVVAIPLPPPVPSWEAAAEPAGPGADRVDAKPRKGGMRFRLEAAYQEPGAIASPAMNASSASIATASSAAATVTTQPDGTIVVAYFGPLGQGATHTPVEAARTISPDLELRELPAPGRRSDEDRQVAQCRAILEQDRATCVSNNPNGDLDANDNCLESARARSSACMAHGDMPALDSARR